MVHPEARLEFDIDMSSIGSNEIVQMEENVQVEENVQEEEVKTPIANAGIIADEQVPTEIKNRAIIVRISQLVFSTLAAILMIINSDFTQVLAFSYFLVANGVLATWSFWITVMEVFQKTRKINLKSGRVFLIVAIGDEVVSFAAFTSACGSAAILSLLSLDLHDTSTPNYRKFTCSTVMGFIAVLLMLPTVHSNFCSNMQHTYQVTIRRCGEFGTLSGLILQFMKMIISAVSLCIGGHGFEGHTVYWAFVILVGIYVVWSFILMLCNLKTYLGGGCDLTRPETIGRWVLFEWASGNALIGAAFAAGSVLIFYSSSICNSMNRSFCQSNKLATIFIIIAYPLSIVSRIIMIGQRAKIQRERERETIRDRILRENARAYHVF